MKRYRGTETNLLYSTSLLLTKRKRKCLAGDQVNGEYMMRAPSGHDHIPNGQRMDHMVDIDIEENGLHKDRKPPLPIILKVKHLTGVVTNLL